MSNYSVRADLHRPRDADALAREIRRLAEQGLTANDIEHALRLDPETVRNALIEGREAA